MSARHTKNRRAFFELTYFLFLNCKCLISSIAISMETDPVLKAKKTARGNWLLFFDAYEQITPMPYLSLSYPT